MQLNRQPTLGIYQQIIILHVIPTYYIMNTCRYCNTCKYRYTIIYYIFVPIFINALTTCLLFNDVFLAAVTRFTRYDVYSNFDRTTCTKLHFFDPIFITRLPYTGEIAWHGTSNFQCSPIVSMGTVLPIYIYSIIILLRIYKYLLRVIIFFSDNRF